MASLHIIGICGTFMGGLAALARAAGHTVTGCDANVYPPMSDQLRDIGIELIEGFDAAQLALAPDLFVVGNVVTRGNPLMEAILDAGAPYVSGPQWLQQQVLPGRHVVAVAGTHGKTTTTAMVVHLLRARGIDCGWLVGGVPAGGLRSAALGAPGSPFVIEADEYDTAFFDKRSKFVHYRPRTAILNNLEFDHADIFEDLAQIERQFHHLVRTIPHSGLIVRPQACEALDRVLAKGVWTPIETFGAGGQWHLADVHEQADASLFEVWFGDRRLGPCRLAMPGAHNRANALAALAAARHLGVDGTAALQAMGEFAGVRRRLEVRGEVRGITVIDDFAHHPSAIEATIAGLRERLGPGPRILAVLEPRSATMRRGDIAQRLPASLAAADRVYCHAAGIAWDAASMLAALGERLCVTTDIDVLVDRISADARAGDRILVMSNGGFGGLHGLLLERLDRMAAGA